jgi:hypothetical protein
MTTYKIDLPTEPTFAVIVEDGVILKVCTLNSGALHKEISVNEFFDRLEFALNEDSERQPYYSCIHAGDCMHYSEG